MTDLSDFLLARIAEDERLLVGGDREPHAAHLGDVVGTMRPDICPTCAGITVSGHRRALAECDAKRQVVQLHIEDPTDSTWDVLYILALPYADHPDYRSEWAR